MRLLAALLLALTVGALPIAQAQKIGSWVAMIDQSDFQVAKTSNSAGSVTGVICFRSTRACSAYLTMDIACKPQEKIPMMISSKIGAFTTEGTCFYFEKTPALIVDNSDATIAAFENGSEVGFVVPMEGGQFRVLRFDTAGATAAIRQARAAVTVPVAPTPTNQTI